MRFAIIMMFATLTLALSAGYLSVMGFAMTFKDTFWQAFALAASLEVGKLVAASFLYRYWKTVKWAMRAGMVAAVVGLMLFTSAGIYSYLSASYQTSSIGLNVNNQRVAMLEQERERSITRKAEIDAQITNLPTEYVRARRQLQASFGEEQARLDKRIVDIDAELLTLKQQTIQAESHVGPVIFVAKTLGIPSDMAVSWFILLVVLVFDPLAVMMTLGTNHVLMESQRKRESPMMTSDDSPNVPHPVSIDPPNGPSDLIVESQKNNTETLEPERLTPISVEPQPDPTTDRRLAGIEDAVNELVKTARHATSRDEIRRNIRTGQQNAS